MFMPFHSCIEALSRIYIRHVGKSGDKTRTVGSKKLFQESGTFSERLWNCCVCVQCSELKVYLCNSVGGGGLNMENDAALIAYNKLWQNKFKDLVKLLPNNMLPAGMTFISGAHARTLRDSCGKSLMF